jgi:hypothetical protein
MMSVPSATTTTIIATNVSANTTAVLADGTGIGEMIAANPIAANAARISTGIRSEVIAARFTARAALEPCGILTAINACVESSTEVVPMDSGGQTKRTCA